VTITDPAPPAVDAEVEDNNDERTRDRLAAATAKIRVRGGLPVDKWFQIAGAALPLLGLLGIVAAWYGVSHTAREWRQTPYVVSGGLLGLGLIFLGGFAYFAYWLTKLLEQSHRQTTALERIEAALTGRRADSGGESDALVVSDGIVHRADCALLAGHREVDAYNPDSDGRARACPVCEPDVPEPPTTRKRAATRRRGATK